MGVYGSIGFSSLAQHQFVSVSISVSLSHNHKANEHPQATPRMTKYTVYKAVAENGVYIRTTTSPLEEVEGTVEHLAEVEGDELSARFAVCFYLMQMRDGGNEQALNTVELESCDVLIRGTIGNALIEFPSLTQGAVEWMFKKYNEAKPSSPKGTKKVKCELCGFECAHKNLDRHKGTSQCKKRQAQNQLTPEQREEAKQARKQTQLEKQRAKVACPMCGVLVTKRHLKRHQEESGTCKKPDAVATAEE